MMPWQECAAADIEARMLCFVCPAQLQPAIVAVAAMAALNAKFNGHAGWH